MSPDSVTCCAKCYPLLAAYPSSTMIMLVCQDTTYTDTEFHALNLELQPQVTVLRMLLPVTQLGDAAGAGSSKLLSPMMDFLSAMARSLEAQQNKATAQHKHWAKQLAALLVSVGQSDRAQNLLAAFPS